MIDVKGDALARSSRMGGFLRDESRNLVDFLLELAEFDRLRRYEALGYAKLGHYCADELKLEEGQIYYRITAARILQRAPIAASYLRDGRLCLTRIAPLGKIINRENAKELLDEASWKSREQIKYLVACRLPKPEQPPGKIRKLPEKPIEPQTAAPSEPVVEPLAGERPSPVVSSSPATTGTPPATLVLVSPTAPPRVEARGEDRFTLPLRFGREFRDDFDRLASIVSHVVPDRDPMKVIHYAIKKLLAMEDKRRGKPKKVVLEATSGADRPYFPIDLERAVWHRDGGKCVWSLANGSLCGSTHQLEIDHIIALALGGLTELANLRLLCAAHNQLHARQTFGPDHIERAIRKRTEAR